ncbi:MAG: DUF5686 family protein [Cyclobacteriaceae bacterium]
MRIVPLLLLIIAGTFHAIAQKTIVSGKVTDVITGAPVPFATVVFTGTTEGAITDFDGNFKTETLLNVDSIEVSYIGYIKRVKPLLRGQQQTINFQLDEDVISLNEVIILPGENPAFAILEKVMENKKKHDKRNLEAYEYESYTRTEFDVDNISDKLKNRKIMSKITNVMDSIEQIAGEDGKPILPVLISEAISRYHYRKNPVARHERMIRTRVNGVGITDGTLTSQVIGSSFQEYNFYQNWMNIISKEFASPIADGWKLLYEYDLTDSLQVEDKFCYQLEFFPKQEQDLAFSGTMWITKDEYALKRIDAQVSKTANVNFIEKLRIQQDLRQTTADAWLPAKTRVIIDVKQLTKNTAGLLAKFYVSNKDFVINQPKDNDFYLNTVSMDPLVRDTDDLYWHNARHDSLTKTEENVFTMIDSLKNIREVKFMTSMARFGATGYLKAGKFDLGPYPTFIGNNDIEGLRIGMGARTNINFSKNWVYGGYIGYGFDDERYKYNAYIKTILNRRPWTALQYEQQREVEQVWLLNQDIGANSLFYALSRFGTLTQPFLREKYKLSFTRQMGKGLNTEWSIRRESLDPLFDFNYYTDDSRTETQSGYQLTEVSTNIRYGKDEVYVINDNDRLSLGTIRSPLFNLKYAYGLDDVAGSDFTYHKLQLSMRKRQKMGVLGVSDILVASGYFFGEAPYSLLFNPIGNESPFYAEFAYSLMDYFEFSADRFVEIRYNHSFEGFLLNRIPLMRKLKWRSIISANILWGDIREENIAISQFQTDGTGNPILPFRKWDSAPYAEVSYGVSNILRVLSIQAFHRLTYNDDTTNKFGMKFNVDLSF